MDIFKGAITGFYLRYLIDLKPQNKSDKHSDICSYCVCIYTYLAVNLTENIKF